MMMHIFGFLLYHLLHFQCWSSLHESFIQAYTRREPTFAETMHQYQLQLNQYQEHLERQRLQLQAMKDASSSMEPCYEDVSISPPPEDEKNEEIVMREEEDEQGVEVVYESLGMLGQRALFGDYVVGEVFYEASKVAICNP